jgi:hypothetical protein
MNGTAYAVFKFHVLHVIKESKTEPMLSGEWLTNRTIEVLLLNSMTPCAKTWHARQPFPELLAEYILFLRTPPGQPGDYTISPRDESSVYRSAAGKVSPLWDECRYEELLTDSFGMCNTCVDTTGVLIEEGTPLVTDDGCLVCECHDRVITCHPKFCDLHTVAIVAGGVVVLALVVVGVTCLYRRYRRRQLANLRARRTVIAHRNTINDDDNANAVPLDPDDNNVVLEEMPRAGLISRK